MKKLFFVLSLIIGSLFVFDSVQAYGECSKYGLMSTYDSITDSCKCMYGYVWGKGVLGDPYCVSGDTYCHDKYGYGSDYDSLSASCECMSGYIWDTDYMGQISCVTCSNKYGFNSRYSYLSKSCECMDGYFLKNGRCESIDSTCHDLLGLMSRYNSLKDNCECMSGYVIETDTFGRESCVYGNTYCHNKYGLHSSYISYKNICECDTNYTLDNNSQCVKKQNNVYFLLKEINTDDREAIIKSTYDYSNYYVKYGAGCFSSTIRRYLGGNIVVNLGTDYDLNTWDYIVLSNDDETCNITSVKKVSSLYSLPKKEDVQPIYIPNLNNDIGDSTENEEKNDTIITPVKKDCSIGYKYFNNTCIKIPSNAHVVDSLIDAWQCDDGYKEAGNACVKEVKIIVPKTTTIENKPTIEDVKTINSNEVVEQNNQKQDSNDNIIQTQIRENNPDKINNSEKKSNFFVRFFRNVFGTINKWFK
jgi:hypothetical protein